MTNSSRRVLCAFAMASTLFPATVRAQAAAQSFADLQRILRVGQMVIVTDASGQETKGKIADVSASALVVLGSDRRTFVDGTITKIRRTDPLWNGALIGAGLGGALVTVGVQSTRGRSDAFYLWEFIGSWLAPAMGAISGALADRAIGTGSVYLAPSRVSRASIAVSPSFARRGRGVLVSFRF